MTTSTTTSATRAETDLASARTGFGAPDRFEAAEDGPGWAGLPIAALDLEATGTDPRTARILEIALVVDDPWSGCEVVVDTLVDPGPDVVIPPGASAINGITREGLTAEGAPPAAQVLRRVYGVLAGYADEGRCVVIYNATYDWPLLGAELARLDPPLSLPDCVLIDPLVLDRHLDRYRRGKRTLERACEVYGVTLDDAHSAGADAIASSGVTRALLDRYADDLPSGPDELHALQVEAHAVWLASYNGWRSGRGMDPIPEHPWPHRG